ncbi:MAG TPA: response regulator [Candidatus Thermoplasmatota archaeon]|nr:response regulator [Candidatus Thermoplasmatota archaeon]
MSLKVLIVDDEPSVLESTRLLLTEFGYHVITRSDHRDTAATVASEKPDVVLHDVRMPGLDIRRLLDSLRLDPATASVPVILFSASLDLVDVQRQTHARGILEKPFQPSELLGALEAAKAGAPGVAR